MEKIKLPPKRDKDYAFKMGVDYSINGANMKNCHFSIFSSPENTKAWEDGKRAKEDCPCKGTGLIPAPDGEAICRKHWNPFSEGERC